MRFSVYYAVIAIAWISITIDAASVKKRLNIPGLRKMTKNPHAMSAEEERFSTCGSPATDMFQVSTISSSQHLCSGCSACIDIEGFLRVPINEGATVRLQVTKFFFNVFDKTYDLCALLETIKDGPRCPIAPNQNGLRACIPLDKSMTTDISASLKVTAYDSWKRQLFCIEGDAMVESECPNNVGPGSYACTH
ncbi:hypothetical protein BGZ52_004699 [Haplosporangium bisporale]|nr:hypothetical protein BGZ52_004699 [Haplosporangium bisporale]